MADNNNASTRLTNWLLGILAAAMFAAIGQLWVMSQGVSKMSATMDEWRTILNEVKDDVRDLERVGAGVRLQNLEGRIDDLENPPGAGR